MKKVLLLLLVVVATLTFIIKRNNDPRNIISSVTLEDGVVTGDLIYKVNFMGFLPVGKAVFNQETTEEYNGRKVYHLQATAQTLKFFSGLFKAEAMLDSYVDTKTRNPLLFRQKIVSPGKERADKEVYYDQEKNTVTLDGINRLVVANTQDPLSLMFNIRHLDFKKIKEWEANINTNNKNYTLKVSVETKTVMVAGKAFKLVFLKGNIKRRDKNSPYHQTKISMLLLKGEENIPVLINIFSSGAFINVRLVDAGDGKV